MDSAEVVTLAVGLPDVVLKEHSAWTSMTVRGKGFAWVNHGENTAMIKGTHEERAACVATTPEVYSEGWASATTAWVSVRLEHADPDEVFELPADGWRMNATKQAVAAFDDEHGLG
jgi:hypothetical protein